MPECYDSQLLFTASCFEARDSIRWNRSMGGRRGAVLDVLAMEIDAPAMVELA